MISLKYTLDNGIELPAAFIVLRTAILHSHIVTMMNENEESVVKEQKDLACSFGVYASQAAYEAQKPHAEIIEEVFEYDDSVNLEEQVYQKIQKLIEERA